MIKHSQRKRIFAIIKEIVTWMKGKGVTTTVNQLRKKIMSDFSEIHEMELISLSSDDCTYDKAEQFIGWLQGNLESVNGDREQRQSA
jgi:lipoate-protein ligase A